MVYLDNKYMAFLDSGNPYRNDSLSTALGYSIGTYLIPFTIGGLIWGFTKKNRPDTSDKDQTNNSDQITN
jgi:hypothetical protein